MRRVALVLGAGSGRRMGVDKLALPYGAGTVLDGALRPLLACALLDEVVLVVQPGRVPRIEGVRVLVNPDHAEGMGSALRLGIASTEADGWLLALADMPAIRPSTVVRMAGLLAPDVLAAPVFEGRRGHPVAVGSAYRSELLAVRGDRGARALLARHAVEAVPVDDPGVVFDVDTPADLQRVPS